MRWISVAVSIEFRRLLRTGAGRWALLLFLVTAAFSCWSQRREWAAERADLLRYAEYQRQDAGRINDKFPSGEKVGYLAYYMPFHLVNPVDAWGALTDGVRDHHASHLRLRLFGLVPQLFESGYPNAARGQVGAFDPAWVIVVLLPLLLAALLYDAVSMETDGGTLPLVASQVSGLAPPLAVRVAVRAGVAFLAFLAASAPALLTAPIDGRLVSWISAGLAYAMFWTGVFAAAARSASTRFNAAYLAALWLIVVFVLPGVSRWVVSNATEQPDGFGLTIAQRWNMNAGWDRPKEDSMAVMRRDHPDWRDVEVPQEKFSWPWYYAMHHAGDASVRDRFEAYFTTLESRIRLYDKIALLLPPTALQLVADRAASADAASQVRFLRSAVDFHQTIKKFFYPLVKREATATVAELEPMPLYRPDEARRSTLAPLAALWFFAAGAMGLAARRWKRTELMGGV